MNYYSRTHCMMFLIIFSLIISLSVILNLPRSRVFEDIWNPVVTSSILIFPYLSSVWWWRKIQFTIRSTHCSWSSIRTFRLLLPPWIESMIKIPSKSFSMASSIKSIVFASSSLYFPWNITVDRIGLSADSFDFLAYFTSLAIISCMVIW